MLLDEYIDALPNPINIIKELDKYVIGQDAAKKNLGVLLLVRALMRLQKNGRISSDAAIEKTNLLLIGPTGCGKTQLLRALSEIADIPILVKDVTGITSAGYIGGKVEDILTEYINLVHEYTKTSFTKLDSYDLEEKYAPRIHIRQEYFLDSLETGIIYLDEIDKLLSQGGSNGKAAFDVTGDMVQNELLKLLEGEVVPLGNSKHPLPECGLRELNTKYITFVCGGAFSGLADIISTRLSKVGGIGFNTEINLFKGRDNLDGLLEQVTTEDLVNYGFKAEFLGRLPLRSTLNALTLPIIVDIINKPKNSIYARYQSFFKIFNVELIISPQAIKEIGKEALKLKLGARSLNQIFNTIFIDDLTNIFKLKDKKLHISKATVISRLK